MSELSKEDAIHIQNNSIDKEMNINKRITITFSKIKNEKF